jgi:hypothetical protein
MLTLGAILSILISSNVGDVKANGDYTIKNVYHTIGFMYNGCVLINDTIELSGQTPNSFHLGFPYPFGSYVLRCIAFDANHISNTFPVTLNEPLENRSGFYGLKVDFSSGAPQNFTVEVLLSNRLVIQESANTSFYTLYFPAFPSLAKTADTCNSSIMLPKDADFVGGTVGNLTFAERNLPVFSYNVSSVTFLVTSAQLQVFDVDQLNRDIRVSEFGDIFGSDSYYITNKAAEAITSVEVVLPPRAFDVSAEDQFGRNMNQPQETATNTSRYGIGFAEQVKQDKSTRFVVNYRLPGEVYLKQQDGTNNVALDMTLFQDVDYYINQTKVTFVLPEGAELQTFEDTLTGDSYGIMKNVFQESVTINKQGVTSLDSFSVGIGYEYNPLWLAFRPTIWALTLAIVGCVAFAIIRRPKAPTTVGVPTAALRLRPEYLKSFAESYEEKMKIITEIDSLKTKAQKGRIPRQRYKVQRRTLETRLETVSRNLEELKEKMRSAGSHYASLLRELEIAETEMNEVEANLKSIESRHSRGEISVETYRKLLGDYQRRKEKTQTTIDGILLRLREEIR